MATDPTESAATGSRQVTSRIAILWGVLIAIPFDSRTAEVRPHVQPQFTPPRRVSGIIPAGGGAATQSGALSGSQSIGQLEHSLTHTPSITPAAKPRRTPRVPARV